MPSQKEHIQFRLDEEPSESLRAEAKRLGCSKNEAARYLLIRTLQSPEVKSVEQFRLLATTAYQLTHLILEYFRETNPSLSEEALITLVNEKVFTPSKMKADKYLNTLGLEQ